jgi:hypothetical protein
MGALEQLRALAKNDMEMWYATCFDREAPCQHDIDMYEWLVSCDPSTTHRLGTVEYKISLVTEDCVYVFYKHLDEV